MRLLIIFGGEMKNLLISIFIMAIPLWLCAQEAPKKESKKTESGSAKKMEQVDNKAKQALENVCKELQDSKELDDQDRLIGMATFNFN